MLFFGLCVTRITEHHFRPATTVKKLLAAHSNNDAIWDNTNQCDVSLDNTSGTEDLADAEVTKESVPTTTTPMSAKDDEIWYNTIGEYDSWYKVAEIMDNYQERDNPPIILEDTSKTNESPKEHVEPDFYLGERQT